MTGWTGGELRRLALGTFGEHADERARDALAHATVTIRPATARWEGSAGPIEAHRVTLGLDARRLGAARATPALIDALCAAIATAVATRPREALLELALRWEPGAQPSTSGGYRGLPPRPEPTLRDALVDYLDGSGEPALARAIESAHETAGEVVVRVPHPSDDARARTILMRAVRDLQGDEATRVRVRS